MKEMTPQKTQEYLKAALDLEMSVYKQTQTRKEARSALIKRNVQKYIPKEPEKVRKLNISKPNYPSPREGYTPKGFIVFEIILGIFFSLLIFIFFIMALSNHKLDASFFPICSPFIAFAIFFFCLANRRKKRNVLLEAQYEQALAEYVAKKQKAEKEAEEEYRKALNKYNIDVENAAKKYEAESKEADISFQNAKKQVELLDAPLDETQKLLEALYAKDIIFEKYRNLVAISTIYEYFASGRCTELTGANGAYNLFETELRQNLIINQLEQVNANLEEIKANQYILYQGISKINNSLDGLAHEIKNIAQSTKEIAVSSRITAICSEVTAQNTLAANYIAILD